MAVMIAVRKPAALTLTRLAGALGHENSARLALLALLVLHDGFGWRPVGVDDDRAIDRRLAETDAVIVLPVIGSEARF